MSALSYDKIDAVIIRTAKASDPGALSKHDSPQTLADHSYEDVIDV